MAIDHLLPSLCKHSLELLEAVYVDGRKRKKNSKLITMLLKRYLLKVHGLHGRLHCLHNTCHGTSNLATNKANKNDVKQK
jgi:hypothetical protein